MRDMSYRGGGNLLPDSRRMNLRISDLGTSPTIGGWRVPENNPFKAVQNAKYRLSSIGQDIPEPEKPNSLLTGAMRALDWIDDHTRGPLAAAVYAGIKGENVGMTVADVWNNRREISGTDILDAAGMQPGLARNALGFVGDVLLDPTTYMSFGTSGVAKTAAMKLGKEAGTELVEGAAKNAIRLGAIKQGDTLGKKSISDLVVRAGRELDELTPGLETTIRSGRAKVNQSFSGLLGEGAADIARKSGDARQFAFDLSDELHRTVMNLADKDKNVVLEDTLNALVRNGNVADNPAEFIQAAATLNKLEAGQLAAVGVLAKKLGPSFKVETLAKHGTSLGKVTSKGTVVGSSRLKNLATNTFQTEIDALQALEAARVPLAQANQLSALVEDSGRLFFRFGGRDLVDFTFAKDFTGRQFQALYTRQDGIGRTMQTLSHTLGEMFQTKYLRPVYKFAAGMAANPEDAALLNKQWQQLRVANDLLYDANRTRKAIPGIAIKETIRGLDVQDIAETAGDDVIQQAFNVIEQSDAGQLLANKHGALTVDRLGSVLALGPKLAGNRKVMDAVAYFLEKDIVDIGEEAVKRGDIPYAKQAWDRIAATLTPDELALVEEAAAKAQLFHEVIKQIDLKLIYGTVDPDELGKRADDYLKRYEQVGSDYILHQYNFPETDAFGFINKAPEGSTQKGRISGKMSSRHSSMNARGYRSIAAAEAAKAAGHFTGDPIKSLDVLMATRLSYTRRAMLAKQLISDLKTLGDIVTTKPKFAGAELIKTGLDGAKDFSRFGTGEMRHLSGVVSQLSGYYAHPEVIRMLKQMDELFTTDDGFNQALRWFSTATNHLKGLQTANLSFLARNFAGEAFMTFVAGVRPEAVPAAYKALRGQVKTASVRGRELDVAYELDQMGKLGGWYATAVRGNFNQNVAEAVVKEVDKARQGDKVIRTGLQEFKDAKGLKAKVKAGYHMWSEPIHSASDFQDRMWRFAHYLDARGRGLAPKDAVAEVRKFHVDYDDLTKVEKNVFRNLAPYYTFMRKNTPNMIRMLFEQPGIYAAVGHLVDNAYAGMQNPEISGYLQESLALPLFRNEQGDVVVLNWNLPITDLTRLKNPFTRDGAAEVLTTMNPMFTTPIQMATNHNLLNGRPISQPGTAMADNANFVLGQFGALGRTAADSKAVDHLLGVGQDEAMTTKPPQIPGVGNPFLLGSLLPVQRPVSVATSNAYRYRDELNARIQELQAQGIPVPSVDQLKNLNKRGRALRISDLG